jgi:hypothetical protein
MVASISRVSLRSNSVLPAIDHQAGVAPSPGAVGLQIRVASVAKILEAFFERKFAGDRIHVDSLDAGAGSPRGPICLASVEIAKGKQPRQLRAGRKSLRIDEVNSPIHQQPDF